ncbi:glutathione S-transferase N-terminal domain-containing protein [Candidatus Nitrosacidococcus sp. I8]|uniref:glutathione S-transferase N-terminal domain-containing protein n=1 Tax=Candidatus Nitrosacidococcus sp. I8 TaxID=2942908 RepID=UPI0022267A01|nr:glutathione S-transferase N-terminal domain-containing protein [Candidatus Nitrosacidococcus sp. I8]CAH9014596.1 Stringent starvation protein A [Candidatus Nitrosacidococcus sp. I8]
MPISNKKGTMILFSDPLCPTCHCIRIIVAEKDIPVSIEYTDIHCPPKNLVKINSYQPIPILIDRDFTLYNPKIIIEYFDERYPHPPLMPIDPASRAQVRMMIHHIEQEWHSLLGFRPNEDISVKARNRLKSDLVILSAALEKTSFFMSECFSLLDATLAPLLWRLPTIGINFSPKTKTVEKYIHRIFSRQSFQQSLSDFERTMRTKFTI